MRALLALALACLTSVSALAQQAPVTGKLQVTLIDETNGVLPGATVTVTGVDAANKSLTFQPVVTDNKGQATFEALPVGRYTVKGEFTGFQSRALPEVRVRAGENRQVLMLPIDRVTSDVTVSRDKQAAASDRDITFGTVLTREQIEALSDDPEELKRQLMDIAGPNAKLFIDSFEGRELPPKALIKSIRITRDQFAPEVHYAGELRIEILTQPGIGPIRGNVRSSFYDSALDGKNPIVGVRGPAQNFNYGAGLSGTLINERASFNLNFNGSDGYSTPVQNASTLSGPLLGNLNLKSPSGNFGVSGGLDYALTKNHVLRMNFNGSRFTRENSGVGVRDFAERAYESRDTSFGFYLQQNGPIGRRMVLNTRLSLFGNDSRIQSAVEKETIIVNEEFTSGGAQRRGGTRGRNATLNADLDYVRGLHSFRMGAEVQYSNYRADSQSNYLGTYVFESLEAYAAGRPRSYTRRIGDPNVQYSNTQGGLYIQDDFKVRKNFTLTGGVRYELQTHVDDVNNIAPRIGFTWSPTKSGKTTLRGSWGVFYDWLSTGTYQQTLQVDGFRQREINVINPSFPEPGEVAAQPVNRYLLKDDLVMAYSQRLSAGIAHTLSRRVSSNILYSYAYRYSLLAGKNLNAPLNGVRPDPTFANVVLASPDGKGTEHSVNVSLNLNLAPMAPTGGPSPGMAMGGPVMMHGGPGVVMVMGGPAGGPGASSGPLFQWRRGLSVGTFYNFGRTYDNTNGAFSIPASQNLADEWGPSSFDRRHNLHASVTSSALRNLSVRYAFSGSSAPPLNITTGFDDNGDLIFNDRPAGVGRNSERTRATYQSSANFSYSFTLGKKTVTSGNGVQIMGSPAGLTVGSAAPTTTPRYRLNLSLNINNLFNQSIYSGFNGVQNSKTFLQPTSASGWRRITFNTSMSF
jgi:hypothetical protein